MVAEAVFTAAFSAVLAFVLITIGLGIYFALKFWSVRNCQFMTKRHNNLSFQQILFAFIYQIYIVSACIAMILQTQDIPVYESQSFHLFSIWIWEFLSVGLLWMSFIKYWHLWYDINYVTATNSIEWHKIINCYHLRNSKYDKEYSVSSTFGNGSRSNDSMHDYDASVSTSSHYRSVKKKKEKSKKKRRDLQIMERKQLATSEHATNTKQHNNNKNKNNSSRSRSASVEASGGSEYSAYDDGIGNSKQNNNNDNNNNNEIENESQPSTVQLEWFIAHKSNLGNDKFTMILGYCIIVVASILLLIIEGFYISHVFSLLLCLFFIFYILPMCLLVYLYYQLHYKLSFEDYFFVGLELKYLFWLLVINQIVYCFVQFGNLNESILNLSVMTQMIISAILLFCCTVLCFVIILFLTKWVIDKMNIVDQRSQMEQISNQEKKEDKRFGLIRLENVLSRARGLNLFMKFLGSEFSMENLLSLIEFMQFQHYIMNHIENNIDYLKYQENDKVIGYLNGDKSIINTDSPRTPHTPQTPPPGAVEIIAIENDNGNDNGNETEMKNSNSNSNEEAIYQMTPEITLRSQIETQDMGIDTTLRSVILSTTSIVNPIEINSDTNRSQTTMEMLLNDMSLENVNNHNNNNTSNNNNGCISTKEYYDSVLVSKESSNGLIVYRLKKKLASKRFRIRLNKNIPQSSIVFNDKTESFSIIYGKRQASINQLKKKCYLLYLKYIAVGSEYEINISYQERLKLTRLMENYQAFLKNSGIGEFELLNMFVPCMETVFQLMQDNFRRFTRESIFRRFANEMMKEMN